MVITMSPMSPPPADENRCSAGVFRSLNTTGFPVTQNVPPSAGGSYGSTGGTVHSDVGRCRLHV